MKTKKVNRKPTKKANIKSKTSRTSKSASPRHKATQSKKAARIPSRNAAAKRVMTAKPKKATKTAVKPPVQRRKAKISQSMLRGGMPVDAKAIDAKAIKPLAMSAQLLVSGKMPEAVKPPPRKLIAYDPVYKIVMYSPVRGKFAPTLHPTGTQEKVWGIARQLKADPRLVRVVTTDTDPDFIAPPEGQVASRARSLQSVVLN